MLHSVLGEGIRPSTLSRTLILEQSSLESEDQSDEESDEELTSLERQMSLENLTDINEHYAEVCFADLARTVASDYGRDEKQSHLQNMQEVWYADAWDDCMFHWKQFLLTYIYEMLPMVLSGLLCTLVEGKVAAKNRLLLFPEIIFPFNLLILNSFLVLFIYWYWSPPGSSSFDIWIVFLLASYRASSIGMKYAYFPTSNMRLLWDTKKWNSHDQPFRALGVSSHFNVVGTFEYDVMMEIALAALRADVFKELPRQAFRCTPTNAQRVWNEVKERLSKFSAGAAKIGTRKHLDVTGVRASKFGDLQALIGLHDIDRIEQEVSNGVLRASIVAYYFAVKQYAPTPGRVLIIIFMGTVLVNLVRPLVRYGFEDTSEDTRVTIVYQVLLAASMLSVTAIFFLYLSYCVLDSFKRNHLCRALLASIGHRQVRAGRLLGGYKDVFLPLLSPGDVVAFWVVQRVLGAELYRGQSIRYNCAYLTVTVVHLLGMFVLVLTSSYGDGLEYSTAAQLLILFVIGTIFVMMATMLASQANTAIQLVRKVLERASLNSKLRGDDKSEEIIDLADLLCTNFEDVLPIQIFYLPATGEVVSLIWTGLLFFAHIMLKELSRQFHVPSILLDFV